MVPRLRIGYFLPPHAEGGIARHVLALVDHLRTRHDMVAFGDRTGEALSQALRERAAPQRIIERYPTGKRGVLRPLIGSWAPMREARAAFLAEHLDVLHFHAGRLGALYPAIVASRWARVPVRLLTVHNVAFLLDLCRQARRAIVEDRYGAFQADALARLGAGEAAA